MTERDALVEHLRTLRGKLAESGVTHLAMFGSRSRGDHRPDSDLDLLIEVEPDRKFSLLDLVGVEHTIGDSLGVQVNAVMKRSLSERLRATIADDIRDVF